MNPFSSHAVTLSGAERSRMGPFPVSRDGDRGKEKERTAR